METDIIEPLLRLQEKDRVCDRLQRKLDDVPVKLRAHTDRIASLEGSITEQETQLRTIQAEADRAELEVKTREEHREKIKRQMNAPKLTNREYEVLQEELAGVLADINSLSDKVLKGLEEAGQIETQTGEMRTELDLARGVYLKAKEELEGSLSDVREQLDLRSKERKELAGAVGAEALSIYERVRIKHKAATAAVEGTIDRVAGRIGNDLHCAACYMSVTANDAVHVLGRRRVIQCKSCSRILFVA
ncbi:MAG: zinc ribbon domain-containing protein [Planctomycetota bacterium]|jgi:predicted  nucleic acid-binding Zn-ribbon protein